MCDLFLSFSLSLSLSLSLSTLREMDLHNDYMDKILIREFNKERDSDMVEKLERNCELGSRRGFSIITNMMGDPLCRIRLYPLHVMLVAEVGGNGEIVGVARGCMKYVWFGVEGIHVRMGCILGLRVSPKRRRMGIATKLVKTIESWAIINGAQYMSLATEENNVASLNLFVLKLGYMKLSSLYIHIQPTSSHVNNNKKKKKQQQQLSHHVKIEKLNVEQAISLYKHKLATENFFPHDIESILKEQLSLGTWVSYFREDQWSALHCNEKEDEFINQTPSSWAIISLWKTCESYELKIRGPHIGRFFHSTLSHITSKLLPCLLSVHPPCELLSKPFGFLFAFGLHGEGESAGELIKSLWWFTRSLAKKVKDCKVVVTELGNGDPLKEHLPWGSHTTCIDDLWFVKRVGGDDTNGDDAQVDLQPFSRIFVDPRDF